MSPHVHAPGPHPRDDVQCQSEAGIIKINAFSTRATHVLNMQNQRMTTINHSAEVLPANQIAALPYVRGNVVTHIFAVISATNWHSKQIF